MLTRILPFAVLLALSACASADGISADSSRPPHPDTDANAAVVVTEFADLECPACRAAHEVIVKELTRQYGNRIRYEFMHFPLVTIHRYALDAAEAAECAADQDAFWEFIDLAYAEQDQLSRESLVRWGEQLSLDMDLYNRCRNSHVKRDTVLANYQTGKDMGVNGTPTFFVNGQRVDSTLEALGTAIEVETDATIQML